MRKRSWTCIAVLVAVMVTFVVPAPVGAATTETFSGSVDATSSRWAVYTIDVTYPTTMTVHLEWDDPSADLKLFVKDPSGDAAARDISDSDPKELVVDAAITGTWKVRVKAASGASDLDLTVTLAGEPPPPPDSYTFSYTLDLDGDSREPHIFNVEAPTLIKATLDWDDPGADVNLFLKDPSGERVAQSTSADRKPETVTYDADVSGTWRIEVKLVAGGPTTYTLNVDLEDTGGGQIAAPQHVRTVDQPGRPELAPSGLDVDEADRLFVADTGNDRVVAYAADGTRSWTTGVRGGTGLDSFDNPRDVAVADGQVYVADTGNRRVTVLDAATGVPVSTWSDRFDALMGISTGVDAAGDPIVLVAEAGVSLVHVYRTDGIRLRTLGTTQGSGDDQLDQARDATTDAAGTVYVADYLNHRIAVFGADGTWQGSFGQKGTAPGEFRLPYGIDVDDGGHLYVADDSNSRLQKLTTAGQPLAQWGAGGSGAGEFFRLRRVAVGTGAEPDVYGADLWGWKIERFSHSGPLVRTYGGTPPPDGGFNEPYGITTDGTSFWVMDTTNQRAQRFALDGTWQQSFGGRGRGDGDPGFDWPRGITHDPSTGMLWVVDTKQDRLIEFDEGGVPTGRQFGTVGTGVGQLMRPFGAVAFDGDLIVVDTHNDRVQRWDPDTGTVVWSRAGAFDGPTALALDGDTVVVADTEHHRLYRMRASDGGFVNAWGVAVLNRVEGVAIAPDGHVWAADAGFNRLVEFDRDGQLLQTFGRTGDGPGEFRSPAHLAIVDQGTQTLLLVVDELNDRVQIFDITPAGGAE